MRHAVRIGLCAMLLAGELARAEPPKPTDDRMTLTMIARQPAIVTPTAIDIGPDGKLYVIESHTHFPPKDYDGPKADRIKVFDPARPDAPPTVFSEGTIKTMGIAWAPADSAFAGWLYLVGRGEVIRVRDADGDGRAELRESVLKLDTTQDYPHNALSGIAFSPDGKSLYIGCGENMGVPCTFVGSDGSGFKVTDGSGNIIRCTPDGKSVTRVATGFWNPFGLAFGANGELFATDNDPDSSPPCRLLHVVPGGDYGFRFQYGRSGRSPLLAWDGELPGTLGMVSGTGESPCEIVHFRGHLIVASWADHRIEMYTLDPTPGGGTYKATMRPLVTGGEHFRPVGLALSPDGKSLYISDWIDRSYTLHKKGRLWRLDGIDRAVERAVELPRRVYDLVTLADPDTRMDDPFWRVLVANFYNSLPDHNRNYWPEDRPNDRLTSLQAMRLAGDRPYTDEIERALRDPEATVRLFAVRWIADERLKQHRDKLDAVLNDTKVMTPQLFVVTLAAMEWLDTGKATPGNGATPPRALLDKLRGDDSPEPMRIMALRLLGPDHAAVTIDLLDRFIHKGGPESQLEAVRSLAARRNSDRGDLLNRVASNDKLPGVVRAEAIGGLAADAAKYGDTLKHLAADADPIVKAEAQRATRTIPSARPRPALDDIDAWVKLIDAIPGDPDPDTGRRIFFNPVLTQCARCHTVDARGGTLGPDLSTIGRRARGSPRFLLESILDPGREVPPYYRPWQLTLKDGSTHVGLLQATGGQGGSQPYLDAAGNPFRLRSDDIAERKLLETSIMPPNLIGLLDDREVRDLIAYLMSRQ